MTRFSRIVAVTAGLLGAGALFGALAGAAVAVLVATVLDGPRALSDLDLLEVGAMFGAPLGAVLFPLTGWLLMRRVPLGRALLGTAAGTVAGGLVGWFVPVGTNQVTRTLAGGILGFALSALVLRRTASAPPGRHADADVPTA